MQQVREMMVVCMALLLEPKEVLRIGTPLSQVLKWGEDHLPLFR